jgi:type II secretory pathway pseudopilin PulG
MAALLVAMSIMSVLLAVAMPVWSHLAKREKEEELVFRGEQYARAIALYQRKFPNAAPPSIDLLVEQRFLRKKYKDPITNDDFVPITQAQAMAAAPGQGASGGAPTPPGGRGSAGRGGQPGAPGAPGTATGGIVGVTSRSTDASIRLYNGRNHYNEWQFVYAPPQAAPGAGGQPGGPGRQGGPGGPPAAPLGRGAGSGRGGAGTQVRPPPGPGR